MTTHGIPLDQAELLSVVLEALLYGFSLLMFGVTIWALFTKRAAHQVNYKMLTAACALLLCSTTHLVIHVMRAMEGLILFRDSYKGGAIGFFADVAQWTFVTKCYLYTVQTVIGDGVILYRCYMVWQSKLIMIIPVLLWCAAGVSGIAVSYTASRANQSEVFGGELAQWISAFWAMELTTSLLTTGLLASRVWYVDRKAARLRSHSKSQLRPILHVIIDAGAIYSLSLLVAMICFESQSNGQYVILDMLMPIISITFYMVIIRVRMVKWANSSTSGPLGFVPGEDALSTERMRRLQVHVMQLTESKIDHGQHFSIRPSSPKYSVEQFRHSSSNIKFGSGGEVVLQTRSTQPSMHTT